MNTISFPPIPKVKAEALGLLWGRHLGPVPSPRLVPGQGTPGTPSSVRASAP